jgi:hypothetical protein
MIGKARPKGVGGAFPVERPVRICKRSLAKLIWKRSPAIAVVHGGRRARSHRPANRTVTVFPFAVVTVATAFAPAPI